MNQPSHSPRFAKAPLWAIVFCFVVGTFTASNVQWGSRSWTRIVEVDAKGYQAYLPAVFIYNDLNFRFFDSLEAGKYYHENYFYDYRIGAHGTVINKYYLGTAVAQLPFFLVAHAIALSGEADADGLGRPYAIAVNVAGLVYTMLGLILLNLLLMHFGASPLNRALTLLIIFFGTNLFAYAVFEPGMSHVFSFAFVALFALAVVRLVGQPSRRWWFLGCFALGMILLIRPVNLLVLLAVPFLAGSMAHMVKVVAWLWRQKVTLFGGVMLTLGIAALQLVYYKLATGHWWVYSYGEEGFNFLDPHMADMLFSYRKGLFVYTPAYLVALVGLLYMSRFQVVTWSAFFLVLTYVLSSWWQWYYGGGFSGRVYVEYLPFFAVPLAVALQHMQAAVRKWYVLLLLMLLLLCQVQTYQYRALIIHWSDMTQERYWEVFMQFP